MAQDSAKHLNALIVAPASTNLSTDERTILTKLKPCGFILFERNCVNPTQIRSLIKDLQTCTAPFKPHILIDQEGGRVTRLKPPHWPTYPPARHFGQMAEDDIASACQSARKNAYAIAQELHSLGITINCTPVIDQPIPGSDTVIGDRAFGTDHATTVALARAIIKGLGQGGIAPVIKHIPGHGRARCDSHKSLPLVDTPLDILEKTDFIPFRMLRDAPYAMTAHVAYTAIDGEIPATLSKIIIHDIIRRTIGFDGFLISDDIEMQALHGPLQGRIECALDAGCDAVLHCSGNLKSMQTLTPPPLTNLALARLNPPAQ